MYLVSFTGHTNLMFYDKNILKFTDSITFKEAFLRLIILPKKFFSIFTHNYKFILISHYHNTR